MSDGKGEERRGKIEKSPQGYEDNASLDKFCKIKGKKGKRETQVSANCRGGVEGNSTTRAPGFDIIHDLALQAQQAPEILEKDQDAPSLLSVPIFA